MLTVDVHKFLVCSLNFFAVSDVLFFLNKTTIRATADFLSAAFDGKVAEEEEEEEEEEALCAKCAEEEEEEEEEEEALCAMCTEKAAGKTD